MAGTNLEQVHVIEATFGGLTYIVGVYNSDQAAAASKTALEATYTEATFAIKKINPRTCLTATDGLGSFGAISGFDTVYNAE